MEVIDIINLSKNTCAAFSKYVLVPALPRSNDKDVIKTNEWIDINGIKYSLEGNTLTIRISKHIDRNYMRFLDLIPDNIEIIIKIPETITDVSLINEIIDVLSLYESDRQVVLNINLNRFAADSNIHYKNMRKNIKIDGFIDYNHHAYKECSLDWYYLNLSEEEAEILLSYVTEETKERLLTLRSIAHAVYISMPGIDNLSIREKTNLMYNWCRKNIAYATEATNADGTFKYGCEWSQDPIETYKRKRGVCEGRAILLKILLNNYYTKVPCYLVSGNSCSLQHEWNEVLDENYKLITCDLSNMSNYREVDESDYKINAEVAKKIVDMYNKPLVPPPLPIRPERMTPPPLPKRPEERVTPLPLPKKR